MSADATWADVGVALVGVSVAVAEAVAHTEPGRWDAMPAQQALETVDAAEARALRWGASSTQTEIVMARGLRSMAAAADRQRDAARSERKQALMAALDAGETLSDEDRRWATYYRLIPEE